MNTGKIVDNMVNGCSLQEWKSLLEVDLENAPNRLRLIEKMRDRFGEELYAEKVRNHKEGVRLIREDIELIVSLLSSR